MRAIDTNIIVRFLTGDDTRQAEKARCLIGEGPLFVATSVLLETEWVLRSAYDFPARTVTAVLRSFCGLPGVTLEDAPQIVQALDWAEAGMDFADALHLAGAQHCSAFLTFDRKLIKAAVRLSNIEVAAP